MLPQRWLLAEWPQSKDAPVKYWLSNLPEDTPIESLVRSAKLRWRVEHDYRELKQCLGLDHYEGRTYRGLNQLPRRLLNRDRLPLPAGTRLSTLSGHYPAFQ